MKRLRTMLLGFAVLIALALISVTVWARTARRPATLGVVDRQLTPCPTTPNCVATERALPDQLMPALPYTASLGEAKARLLEVVQTMPRTTIVSDEQEYIAAEFRTPGIGFIDDVEFRFDDNAKLIHFRSASRLGRGDIGVNRARMESVSRAFNAAQ